MSGNSTKRICFDYHDGCAARANARLLLRSYRWISLRVVGRSAVAGRPYRDLPRFRVPRTWTRRGKLFHSDNGYSVALMLPPVPASRVLFLLFTTPTGRIIPTRLLPLLCLRLLFYHPRAAVVVSVFFFFFTTVVIVIISLRYNFSQPGTDIQLGRYFLRSDGSEKYCVRSSQN